MVLHAWNHCKIVVSSSGVVVTLERNILFLGLGLTVTEINIKKKVQKQDLKNIKNVKVIGMVCQKVCKEGRDDIIVKINPYPYIFLHYSCKLM